MLFHSNSFFGMSGYGVIDGEKIKLAYVKSQLIDILTFTNLRHGGAPTEPDCDDEEKEEEEKGGEKKRVSPVERYGCHK
jgi:hypothetical protein